MGVVPRALAISPVVRRELPFLAAIVGAEQTALLSFDQRIHAVWVGSGRHADASDNAFRQALACQFRPGVTPVGRAIQTASRTAGFHGPRLAHCLPHAGKQNVGVRQVELDINAARPVVHVENALPGLAAIARTEYAPGGVRSEGMAEGRDVDGVRILGMNNHAADGIGVAQAGELPGLPGVNGFVDAIAHHNVAADTGFAGADIDHVRIRWRHGNRTDRGRGVGEFIPERLPIHPAVGGLPHASGDCSEVVGVVLAGHASDGNYAAAAERANKPVFHALKGRFRSGGLWLRHHSGFERKLLFRWFACRAWRDAWFGWFIRLTSLCGCDGAQQEKDNHKAGVVHS